MLTCVTYSSSADLTPNSSALQEEDGLERANSVYSS